MDQIQRNGEWWHRQPNGEWLKFDVASGQWMSAGAPPPPSAPPPVGEGGDGPYAPLSTASRSRFSQVSLPQIDRRVGIVGGLAVLVTLLAVVGFFAFGGNEPAVDLAAAAAPNPEPEPLSKKQQFIRDADQMCADVLAKAEALPQPQDLPGLIAMLNAVWSINDEATRRAQSLQVPRDARAGWDRFVGHPEDGRRIKRTIAAAQAGDVAELERLLSAINKSGVRDRAWAERYGMKICSRRSLPQA